MSRAARLAKRNKKLGKSPIVQADIADDMNLGEESRQALPATSGSGVSHGESAAEDGSTVSKRRNSWFWEDSQKILNIYIILYIYKHIYILYNI